MNTNTQHLAKAYERAKAEVITYARDYPGSLAQLAREAGVSPEWLQKFVSGQRKNPTVETLQAILDHKEKSKAAA